MSVVGAEYDKLKRFNLAEIYQPTIPVGTQADIRTTVGEPKTGPAVEQATEETHVKGAHDVPVVT